MEYQVQWRYFSSLGGPWQKGDVVEMDEPLAEAINRDSPGVLKPKGTLNIKKGKDRMVKKAETRVKQPLEAPGSITKADFKAVRG